MFIKQHLHDLHSSSMLKWRVHDIDPSSICRILIYTAHAWHRPKQLRHGGCARVYGRFGAGQGRLIPPNPPHPSTRVHRVEFEQSQGPPLHCFDGGESIFEGFGASPKVFLRLCVIFAMFSSPSDKATWSGSQQGVADFQVKRGGGGGMGGVNRAPKIWGGGLGKGLT